MGGNRAEQQDQVDHLGPYQNMLSKIVQYGQNWGQRVISTAIVI